MADDQQHCFDLIYREFEDKFRGAPELIRQRLSTYLPLLAGLEDRIATGDRKALDLGAGRGEWLRLLRARGWHAVGVDSNASMVQAAQEAGIDLVEADMFAFLRGAESESFDVVSAFHVVEHIGVDELNALLRELTRVLKPGGLVILETPNPENLTVASWSFRLDPTHRQPLPPALLEFLSRAAGLQGTGVLRLNGDRRPAEDGLVSAIDAAFRTAPDYALLATKAGSPDMLERIAAFVAEHSEPAPRDAMRMGLAHVESTLGEHGRQVIRIEPLLEQHAVTRERVDNALAQGGARARDVDAQLDALRAEVKGLREQVAILANRPSSAIDHAHRVARGAKAWLAFRPGSRPHRLAKRAVIRLYDEDRRQSPGVRAIKTAIGLFPSLERRAQLVARRTSASSSGTVFAEPPGSPAFREPESVQVAFTRLNAVGAAGDERHVRQEGTRPRLAYVSPLPPARTGVADSTANLLPALARHYDITLIVEQDEFQSEYGGIRFEVADAGWFKRHAAEFDRVLYQFGNSTFHTHMIELIRRHPGVVAMHDVSTGDLFIHLEWHEGWDHFWSRELLDSHGYEAVRHRFENQDLARTIASFPANLRLLREAQGIVVHSEYARAQFERSFSAAFGQNCRVVPLTRDVFPPGDRKAARAALGLSADHFIVCTMGAVGASKCTHRLVEAWIASGLADDESCRLIVVGNAPPSDYSDALLRQVKKMGGGRMTVTGYATPEEYQNYIVAADCAVQLRNQGRGETSGALLDCLAEGRAVILNAHGSMAETPSAAAIVLPEIFETSDLANALKRLRRDPGLRERLGEQARLYIAGKNGAEAVAARYRTVLEEFAQAASPLYSGRHLAELRSGIGEPESREALLDLAKSIAPAYAARRPVKQLLVDVSAIAHSDLRTGIQRVVRAQLLGLIAKPPAGFRVEPVALRNRDGRWRYEYARDYGAKLNGLPEGLFSEQTVDAAAGDILFVADFWAEGINEASKAGLYEEWRDKGVSINIAVYDILPLTMPQYFPPSAEAPHRIWLENAVQAAHRLICISDATADEVRSWIADNHPNSGAPAIVGIPLGADIQSSLPTSGLPHDARETLSGLRVQRTFIMVGTIEPRKGHLQAIAAFEELWSRGRQERLLVVGGEGWRGVPADQRRTIPDIVQALRGSREFGRKLIWIDDASDAYLDELYRASACLLAPSEGEGFGLPVIEAARHGLPIFARDIPVFREIAGRHASYFSGLDGADLADALEAWLERDEAGETPRSEGVNWLTWAQNVERVTETLVAQDG